MELFEEEVKKINKPKEKKNFKVNPITLLKVGIIGFGVLGILLFAAILYLKSNKLEASYNGSLLDSSKTQSLVSCLRVNDENNIEVSIKKMASFLGYSNNSGDYENLVENENKRYISYNNQVVLLEKDSNVIKQIYVNDTAISESETITLNQPIGDVSADNDMYVNLVDACKILSIQLMYNKNSNKIALYDLDSVFSIYQNRFINSNGYVEIKDISARNKMAIMDNLLVVKDSSGNYGVIIASSGEVILELKYDSITYLRGNSDFLVSRNNKYSIISSQKVAKLENYDKISVIKMNDASYYLLTLNSKYGISEVSGTMLIYPEYSGIGITKNQFPNNEITNQYLLAGTYIPLKNDKAYYLYNLTTKQFVQGDDGAAQYTGLGYSSTVSGINSTIQILDYGLVVVQRDKKYDLINQEGKALFGTILDAVYFTTSAGSKTYYIEYQNNSINLYNFLEKNNIKKVR